MLWIVVHDLKAYFGYLVMYWRWKHVRVVRCRTYIITNYMYVTMLYVIFGDPSGELHLIA